MSIFTLGQLCQGIPVILEEKSLKTRTCNPVHTVIFKGMFQTNKQTVLIMVHPDARKVEVHS